MSRGTRARKRTAVNRRARFLVPGAVVLAVLIGGGLYLAVGVFGGGPAAGPLGAAGTGCATATAAAPCTGSLAVAAQPTLVTVPPGQAPGGAQPTETRSAPSASGGSPAATVAAATGTGSGQSTAPVASASASPPSSPAAPSASASPVISSAGSSSSTPSAGSSPAQRGSAAAQVLALINQARSAAGLPALTIMSGLNASSSAHNRRMADGCGLSHQCTGEPSLGDRETAAGIHWTAAGENIGEGGPVTDTDTAIAQMAVGLTQSMLSERPPNDGHRLNILSRGFTHIGIAVERDSKGTVWLTQDFSN